MKPTYEELEAKLTTLTSVLRMAEEAFEKMISPETDWDNGEVGVGYRFRGIAQEALEAIRKVL